MPVRMRFQKFCLPILFAASTLICSAQTTKSLANTDVAVEGLYQTTSTASGDGISVTATHSAGGAAFLSHSYHWWLGWQAGYVNTRYTNYYTGQIFGVQTNMHEIAGSYYVRGPRALGIQPFATAGVSAVIFSPTLNGGQNAAWQARPGINFGVGVNVPLLSSHFGLRVQYRGIDYKTPDFEQTRYTTGAFRMTSEPMAGLYLRF